MTARGKHTKLSNRRKNSRNEKIQLPSTQTREIFHFVGAGNQECDKESEEREERRPNISEVLSVQPWQGPPYRRIRAARPAKAVHTFGSKFFQIRTPGSLIAVLAEKNLLVSAEITDIQAKQQVGLRYNKKVR